MERVRILDTLLQAGIPLEQAEYLIQIGTFKNLKSKELALSIGEKCDKCFFILRGSFVSQYLHRDKGDEITINFHLPNFQPFMIAMDAYFSGTKSVFQLKAISNSDVLIFSKADMEYAKDTFPAFKDLYINKIINALVAENELKSRLIALTSEDLYKYLLSNKKELIKQVPAKYIAEFMGITREHLSRLKHQLFTH